MRRIPWRLGAALALAGLTGGCPASAGAIVGGSAAHSEQVRSFAAFAGCGATLIAPDRLLTAAHCVAGRTPGELGTVRFPEHRGLVRHVTAWSAAPAYVRAVLDGTVNDDWSVADAAVVALDAPVDVVTVHLAGRRAPAGTLVSAVGLGRTRTGGADHVGAVPARLVRAARLRVSSRSACGRYWAAYRDRRYRAGFDASSMFCAHDPRRSLSTRATSQRGICFGDSGGPAFQRLRNGALRQVGIVSWLGDACGRTPSVFADVGALRAFIGHPVWAPVPADEHAAASISGTPAVGSTLTCASPAWATPPPALRYRWSAVGPDDHPRTRSDGAVYDVAARDRGLRLQCAVSAITAGGVVPARAAITAPVT